MARSSMGIGVGILCLGLSCGAWAEEGKVGFEFESGFGWVNKNTVQIPGDTGTRFRFADLTGRGSALRGRWQLTWEGEDGPGWRVLYAPLVVRQKGALDSGVGFAGSNFGAGVATEGRYQFNSYRITYRNRWRKGPTSDWRVGFTLKARDAEIRLSQGGQVASDKNFGLVPLIHVYGEEELGDGWRWRLDFDGLAAPQGRAFDVAVQIGREIGDGWVLWAGYRTLEGGVDNDRVYNFFWGQSVTIGVAARF